MPARLAQHLVSKGLLPPEKVEPLTRQQAVIGGALDTLLLEEGWVAEAQLLEALGELSGQRAVNLADYEPNPEVASFIPPKIADRLCVVPLSLDGQLLHVACAYPAPKNELDEVAFLLGKQIELWVATEVRVRDWIATVYKQPLPARFRSVLAALDPSRAAQAVPRSEPAAAQGPAPQAAPVAKPGAAEELSLEEQLAFEMVSRVAQSVVEEPIPLEVRKIRRPAPAASVAQAPPPEAPVPPPAAAPGRAEQPRSAPPAPRTPVEAPPPELARYAAAEEAALRRERKAREVVPDWSLEQARGELKGASEDRDRLIDVALRFGRRTFDFVAAFAVIRGGAVGWDARGEAASREQMTSLSFPLDSPSVFRTVARTRSSYVGPTPNDELTRQFLAQLGRQPRSMLLYPVEVKSRLVAFVYGDSGQRPPSQRRLSEFVLFCQDLPNAFGQLIVLRKQRGAGVRSAAAAELEAVAALPPAPAPSPAPKTSPFGVGWGSSAQSAQGPVGRAASISTYAQADAERPPPDFGPVLRRLTGPDATQRARAIAELVRTPEASARALAQAFPGPTAWARMAVPELPEADELGPIPAALSRLGRAGAQALAPLLDAYDSDVRYLALLTAGNLPYPELVDGVMRGLFDLEPDISSAARAAATALRRLTRFETGLRAVRQELTSRDSLRRSLAARALGVLHDREAIEGLIGLTGSQDQLTAQAAADALTEITRTSFGTNPREWTMWWAENRSRRRAQWLVASLRHPDEELRTAAIEELTRVVNDSLGYAPDAPAAEREAAVRRWEELLQRRGFGQALEVG